mgnify:CR=1 FL=1
MKESTPYYRPLIRQLFFYLIVLSLSNAFSQSYWKPLARSLGNDGRTDHITLKDTGEFYKSFRIKLENDGFRITANAIKEDTDLAQIYPKVIGLTKENKAEVVVIVAPYLAEIIRKERDQDEQEQASDI